ncbi:MAG: hypothetical protein HZA54_06335 [Planctomycetes bacterium]|nr:hypothetical protein [Planctomycetota bacterium]
MTRRYGIVLILMLLSVTWLRPAAADEAADLRRMLEAAPARLREASDELARLPALASAKAPTRAAAHDPYLCPGDGAALHAVAPADAPAGAPAPAAPAAWLCLQERALYVVTPGAAPDAPPEWKGPLRLFPVTREAVQRALQRHLSDSGQQGFYSDRFPELRLAGPDAALPLLAIYREDLNEQLRQLALEALGEVGNPAVIPDLTRIAAAVGVDTEREAIIVTVARLGDRALLTARQEELHALADSPDRPAEQRGAALSQLALLHARLEENDQALACYLKARDLAPGHPVLRYNLACSYAILGKADDAFRELEAAVGCGFDQWEWVRMDGDLEKLHADPRWEPLLERMSRRPPAGHPPSEPPIEPPAGDAPDPGGAEDE